METHYLFLILPAFNCRNQKLIIPLTGQNLYPKKFLRHHFPKRKIKYRQGTKKICLLRLKNLISRGENWNKKKDYLFLLFLEKLFKNATLSVRPAKMATEMPTERAEDPTERAEDPTDKTEDPTDKTEDMTERAEDLTDKTEDPTDVPKTPTDGKITLAEQLLARYRLPKAGMADLPVSVLIISASRFTPVLAVAWPAPCCDLFRCCDFRAFPVKFAFFSFRCSVEAACFPGVTIFFRPEFFICRMFINITANKPFILISKKKTSPYEKERSSTPL